MPSDENGNGEALGPVDDKEFLYSVLNLPTTATEQEIRERYRQLSIIFHPDKQQNERTKETATKRFLEVQKAYEVLSNPLTRQAYDLYGPEGLKLLTATDYSELSTDEVREVLKRNKLESERARLGTLMESKGHAAFNLNISSFFEERDDLSHLPWQKRFAERLAKMPHVSGSVRQNIQKAITPNTTLKLSARSYTSRPQIFDGMRAAAGTDFLGTIRHQFSPHFSLEGQTSLLLKGPLKLKASYGTKAASLSLQTLFSPVWFKVAYEQSSRSAGRIIIPVLPVTLTFSRRLFPHSNAQGIFTFSTATSGPLPSLSFSITSAHPFDHAQEVDAPPSGSRTPSVVLRPPSRTGLGFGVRYYSLGMSLDSGLPGLTAIYGITFAEVGVQLKAVGHAGLQGLTTALSAIWTGANKGADAEVSFGSVGVRLRLGFVYLNHRLELPIQLSHDHDVDLAFWTTLFPTTALALAYHFVLRPLERKRRMAFFRRARRELRDAQSDSVRQTEETIYLLQETAKRHMQSEAAIDGLVILEASYGARERDEYTEGLEIDVTIPMQALVNKSQLHIPGRKTKAGLQGFRDPVPNVAKSLRVRYTFRGREHYAEIPDYHPVVLPLEDHLAQ